LPNGKITPKAIEEFYSQDKSNVLFWLSKTERYSKERVIQNCMRVGVSEETANKIAREIDRYADSRVKMSDIRPLIYALLQRYDQQAARRFKAGEIFVSTSLETFERFDRSRITDSIVKETGLDEQSADMVAFEAEKFIKTANLDNVSSALIREIVNVKLLEHGFYKERNLYTRIGMPVYDLTTIIDKGDKENANLQYNPETIHKIMADQMSKEYTLLKILPKEMSDAHLKGNIHIHDMDYFFSRPFCFSHDIRFFIKNGFRPDGTGRHTSIAGPAKSPEVAFLHAAKVLAASQTNCAGGQGFSYFNTFMAPVVAGLGYKQMKQLAQMFIYEMSQMYVARGGQVVFSSIDLDMHVPDMLKDIPVIAPRGSNAKGTYADYEDETRQLFNAFLDVYLKGDWQGKPFNFPKFEVMLDPKKMGNGYSEELYKVSELAAKFGTPYYIIKQPYMPEFSCYQCCAYLMPLEDATDEDDLKNGTVRGGSLQVVTLNLPQIAYESDKEESRIYELIDQRLQVAKNVMILRKELIEKNLKVGMLPFLAQKVNEKGDRYFEPSKQSYTIGVLGFNEMVKYHTGSELHESQESWMFGLRVMKYIKEKVAKLREETGMFFALARTPAEATAYRFALIDRKRYPNKAIYQGNPDTNAIYYTNSFHVRPNADIPLFKRMQTEGAFHPLTDGGAMSHVWFSDANPDPEAVTQLTKQLATKTAIQYMAFTKDLTICDDCGFTFGSIGDKCPSCQSANVQTWSRITGYYQNITGWNKGKLQELKDRRRYGL